MIITDWMRNNSFWRDHVQRTVDLINRHPNRRAFIIFDKSRTKCRVVDDAVKIYDGDGKIREWVLP